MIEKMESSGELTGAPTTPADNARPVEEAEVDYSDNDYRSFVIFGTFATKVTDPEAFVLTDAGRWQVEEAVEDSLREDGIVSGLCMTTGVGEVLHSLEEARDQCIRETLEQPSEVGRVRGWVLASLLRLYRLVQRGAKCPDRY